MRSIRRMRKLHACVYPRKVAAPGRGELVLSESPTSRGRKTDRAGGSRRSSRHGRPAWNGFPGVAGLI